jgi:mannose-6-phosphate isomerase-like protein (cupin superfamily)
MDSADRPLHIRSGSKATYWFREHDFRFLGSADETGGTYSLMEIVSPPDSGPIPHTHDDAEEAFYVLDGDLTFHVGDESFEVSTGDFVHVPRGTVHSFRVKGRPAKYLAVYAPGGEERRFQESG